MVRLPPENRLLLLTLPREALLVMMEIRGKRQGNMDDELTGVLSI